MRVTAQNVHTYAVNRRILTRWVVVSGYDPVTVLVVPGGVAERFDGVWAWVIVQYKNVSSSNLWAWVIVQYQNVSSSDLWAWVVVQYQNVSSSDLLGLGHCTVPERLIE